MRNLKSQMMLPSLFVQIQKNIMSIVQIKISIGCFRPFWLIRIKGYAIFLHSCNKHRSKSLAFFPGSEKEKRNSSIGSMNTSCIDIMSWCIKKKLFWKQTITGDDRECVQQRLSRKVQWLLNVDRKILWLFFLDPVWSEEEWEGIRKDFWGKIETFLYVT